MAGQPVSARDLPVFGFLESEEHISISGFYVGSGGSDSGSSNLHSERFF